MSAAQAESRRKSTPWHYKVLWAIMADPDLQAPSKCAATILLLRYHNHKTGQCNPSFSAVGKLLGRDRSNAVNAINALKAAGWIEWMGTKGGSSSNTNAFKFKMKDQAGTSDDTQGEVTTPTQGEVTTGGEVTQGEVTLLPRVKSLHEPSYKPSKEDSCRVAKATPTKYSKEFEEAWQAYPRRLGGTPKSPAAKRFLSAVKAGTDPQIIIDAVKRFAIAESRNVGTVYIPQMVKWLNHERWLDCDGTVVPMKPNHRGNFI